MSASHFFSVSKMCFEIFKLGFLKRDNSYLIMEVVVDSAVSDSNTRLIEFGLRHLLRKSAPEKKKKGFRGMELVPADRRSRQVMVATIRLLLLLLTLALVVGLVILTSSQKWEESAADKLNTSNGSQDMEKIVLRKLRPPPKPCPGGKNW